MQFHGATIFASERDFKIVGFLNFIKNIYISDFFEGIAIGNGYLNAILNVNSLVSFSYNHGIVSEKIWEILEDECCRKCVETCKLTELDQNCSKLVSFLFIIKYDYCLKFLYNCSLRLLFKRRLIADDPFIC